MIKELNAQNFTEEINAPVALVDFWTPWCGPCRMQGPILEDFASNNANVKVCKVNVDENPELSEKFSIMSIPSLLVFKNGSLVKTAVGLHDKSALAEMVK